MQKLYETEFFPRLRELTQMPDATTETMFDVNSYLYWAVRNNLDLKFDLSEEDIKWLYADASRKLW